MPSEGFKKGHKRKNSHLFMEQAASGSSMTSYDIELDNMDTTGGNSSTLPPLNSRTVSIDNIPTVNDLENQSIHAQSEDELKVWEMRYWNEKFSHNRRNLLYTILFGIILFTIVVSYHWINTVPQDIKYKQYSTNPNGFSIENVFNGEFDTDQTTFHFITPPEILTSFDKDPGLYFTTESDGDEKTVRFIGKQLYSKEFRKDLGPNKFNFNGVDYLVDSVKISYNLDKIIFATNTKHQFRYSSYAQYWIKDVATSQIKPLTPLKDQNEPIDLAYAYFSPNYNFAYFNYKNNIYLKSLHDDTPAIQITFDNDENILNGKTDWIYEEEVLASNKAIWWSPDDRSFVFAQFNEKDVPIYEFPKYTEKQQYNPIESIKYPKPGKPNPSVKLFMFDLSKGVMNNIPTLTDNEFILYDLQWIDNENFLFKITDRFSKELKVIRYDTSKAETTFIRSVDTTRFNGWVERVKKLVPVLPDKSSNRLDYGYLDIHEDKDGFNHVFYYPTIDTVEGTQLTFGSWEVTESGVVGISYEDNVVYFTANKISNMGQHIYAVHLNKDHNKENNVITIQNPNDVDIYYDFELSSSTRYVMLKRQGPIYPEAWVGALNDLFSMSQNEMYTSDKIINLINAERTKTAISKYDFPVTSYKSMILEDGVEINYKEIKPSHIDPKRKYPLLVNIYGGPGSITYTKKSSILLEESVASGLNAIVLQIEPRGTGGKGWSFKQWATGKLGHWEPRDITEVTKRFIKDNVGIINENHVAIWGWSYGGFTTLKTIEFDEGKTFKYAVAVAPVTNWKYYDSIYTERYMGSIEENQDGYNHISLIDNVEPFKSLDKFMIIHGTADDNVHIQNTYDFVDELTLHNVRNYEMEIFPDSDHSIKFHNAQKIIFERLYHWFEDAFNGKFAKTV